jgi:hypothetical protein
MKKFAAPSGIERVTFLLVAQGLKQADIYRNFSCFIQQHYYGITRQLYKTLYGLSILVQFCKYQ